MLANSLLAMHMMFGNFEAAWAVFDGMRERDLTSWNTMIFGYARNGKAEVALLVFRDMKKDGLVLDGTTLLALLTALSNVRGVKQGKEVHAYAVRNGDSLCNGFVVNALIDVHCTSYSVLEARRLFEATVIDTSSWNLMISAYVKIGDALERIKLFCRMVREGIKPEEVTVAAVFWSL